MTPYFSIVLPVYNGLNYIDESINSVLNQTFTNFELIIVNDGSTDGTKQYLDTLITHNKDPRIIIIHQENKKTASAINNGFSKSRGEYLTWTSHDNIMCNNFLSTYYDKITEIIKNNNKVHFIYSGCTYFGDYNWVSNKGLVNLRELFFDYPGIASFMWSKDTINKVGEFDPDLHGIEDLDYIWRTIEYNPQIYNIKQSLYLFRMHKEQATHDFNVNNKWNELTKKFLTKFVSRNIDDFNIKSFYPYIDYCINKQRSYCIAFYDLGMWIIKDKRKVYRDNLLTFAQMCFKKSYEYDNSFEQANYIVDILSKNINNINNINTYTYLEKDKELFNVERQYLKEHEFN
jgi:glycosyltransferase involved in cell wall biosynthesis